MQKVILTVSLNLQKVPDPIEFPDPRPGEDPLIAQGRLISGAARVFAPAFGRVDLNPAGVLNINRSIELEISGDLHELAEIASKLDRLVTDIEARSIAVMPNPPTVEGPDGHSAE